MKIKKGGKDEKDFSWDWGFGVGDGSMGMGSTKKREPSDFKGIELSKHGYDG